MKVTMNGKELYDLSRELKAAAEKTPTITNDAVRKTSISIAADAKEFAPVKTGNLKNSISYDITADTSTITAEIGPTAEYGAHVENGTSTQRPQPYLRPAADRQIPALQQALAKAIRDALT